MHTRGITLVENGPPGTARPGPNPKEKDMVREQYDKGHELWSRFDRPDNDRGIGGIALGVYFLWLALLLVSC